MSPSTTGCGAPCAGWMTPCSAMCCSMGPTAGLLSKTPRRLYWIWRPVGGDNVKFYHELLGYPMAKVQEWYDKAWI
jgi:hypothetical protein